MQIIKTGPAYKNGYVIEEGLKSGDKVVMGGTSLLKNGSVITPKEIEWTPGQEEIVPTK